MELPGQPSQRIMGARKLPRDKPIPKGWFIIRKGTLYNHLKRYNELAGIKGGEKELWIRQNKTEILEYYDKNGIEATKNRYLLKSETLEALLGNGRRQPFVQPFTKMDKLELRIEQYRCDAQDLKREIAELREAFAGFQGQVAGQITKKFLLPLLQHLQVDDTLGNKLPEDPLRLNILSKGG